MEVLNYISNTLQLGKVCRSDSDATFEITKLSEIAVILTIFLNTTKHLNFLSFEHVF